MSAIAIAKWDASERRFVEKRQVYKLCQKTVEYLSGEWILTRGNIANGGTVILLRSAIVATVFFVSAIVLAIVIDPDSGFPHDLRKLATKHLSWYGASFAASYAAFYTRFASQWLYLSNLYNMIKQSESSVDRCCRCNVEKLNEWKAGFLEDVETLHMVRKRVFSPIIKAWGEDPDVKEKYRKNTPGGMKRLERVVTEATDVVNEIEESYA